MNLIVGIASIEVMLPCMTCSKEVIIGRMMTRIQCENNCGYLDIGDDSVLSPPLPYWIHRYTK